METDPLPGLAEALAEHLKPRIANIANRESMDDSRFADESQQNSANDDVAKVRSIEKEN